MSKKAALGVKNKDAVLRGLTARITRMRNVEDELYREIVEKIFRRVLNQTPQFTGSAVGHWVIGIGRPEILQDDSIGDQGLKKSRRLSGEVRPLQRGNRYWINVALRRELPKIARITKGKRPPCSPVQPALVINHISTRIGASHEKTPAQPDPRARRRRAAGRTHGHGAGLLANHARHLHLHGAQRCLHRLH